MLYIHVLQSLEYLSSVARPLQSRRDRGPCGRAEIVATAGHHYYFLLWAGLTGLKQWRSLRRIWKFSPLSMKACTRKWLSSSHWTTLGTCFTLFGDDNVTIRRNLKAENSSGFFCYAEKMINLLPIETPRLQGRLCWLSSRSLSRPILFSKRSWSFLP